MATLPLVPPLALPLLAPPSLASFAIFAIAKRTDAQTVKVAGLSWGPGCQCPRAMPGMHPGAAGPKRGAVKVPRQDLIHG